MTMQFMTDKIILTGIKIKEDEQKMARRTYYRMKVSSKSKGFALFLCIIGGWCGAHQFYVGKKGMGILYLCTFGLFFIGWIIDLIAIISGAFEDSNGLPLKV